MAVAGDILIKLAVDFAEFVAGMDRANAKLDEQGKHFADHGAKLDNIAKQLAGLAQSTSVEGFASKLEGLLSTFGKFAGIGTVIGIAGAALDAFIKQQEKVIEYAESIDKLRNTFQITGEQAQVFQRLAEQLKVPVEGLIKDLQGDPAQLAAVTKAYKDQFAVLDPVKIGNVAAAQRDLNAQWEKFVGLIANDNTNEKLDATTNKLKEEAGALGTVVGWLAAYVEYTRRMDAANEQRKPLITFDPSGRPPSAPGAGQDPRAAASAAAQAERERQANEERIRQEQGSPDVFAQQGRRRTAAELAQLRAEQAARERAAATTTTGGGGGRTDDDLVEGQIRRYDALASAAEKAYKTIENYQGQDIEQLTRNVAVQRQIDDIVGKLDAKYIEAHKDELARLRVSVSAAEEARAAQDLLLKTTTDAINTERKYGDGKAVLAKIQTDLNRQLATGKLTGDAWTRSLKEQTEAAQSAARQATRYDDSLGSLAEGFADAAAKYARANDLYAQGGALFNGVTQAMTDGLQLLSGQSSKTFAQILNDFATMLEQMAIKAAVSQVFKILFPGTPSFNAGDVEGVRQLLQPLPVVGTRQHGGPVAAGQPYIVGEAGPERFVPDVAGTIVPSTSLGVAPGVTVNVDMTGGGGSRATPKQTADFARKMKQAVLDTINQEKRPGGSLYAGVR